ncbi:MAG TPA: hypothetical protein PK854_02465 [Oscillospiraceae bacterium]|nr:hypothetical protein [Oscillospiraceae bacterium]HPS34108.1 hypothetical protein [Oscillospiraceae bacterium]
MKKWISLILALVLMVMLPGCGLLRRIVSNAGKAVSEITESGEPSEPETESSAETVSNYDYSATDTIYGQMSASEKQAFIEQAKLSGTDVTFNADGSTTFTYEDGSVTKQNADGTWTYSDEDGTATTQFGGEWPDNEFTRLVPKPDFGELFGAVTEEKSFIVMFTNPDLNKMRAYIQAVKAKGFTIDAENTDETAFGVTVLSYKAKNAAGFEVTVASAAGVNSISISKE